VPRRGYRFVAPVVKVNGSNGERSSEIPASPLPANTSASSAQASLLPQKKETRNLKLETFSRRRVPALALTLAVVVTAGVGITYMIGRDKAGASPPPFNQLQSCRLSTTVPMRILNSSMTRLAKVLSTV